MTTVVYLENALTPHLRRVEHVQPSSIRELAPDWQVPFVAFVDGRPVLRADWELVIEDDHSLAFVEVGAIPQGGGGGGSDPLRIVLMAAVLYYTAGAGGAWLTGAGSLTGATGITGALVGGVGAMVGMALINAIIPPPKAPSTQQASALAAPSPTYSVQAQGNQARLDAAIPEHFGRLKVYPDFAAQPYQEFFGNEQYVYELLCVGRGSYDIVGTEIYIEDTPISNFAEIDCYIIQPGDTPTAFPSSVSSSVEVSGQTIDCMAATFSQVGTAVTITCTDHGLSIGKSVYIDFAAGVPGTAVYTEPTSYSTNNQGMRYIPGYWTTTPEIPGATDGTFTVASTPTANTFTVVHTVSVTTSGACNVSPWLGGFIANASGTLADAIGLDFIAPKGLYYAQDNGSLATVAVHLIAEARTVNAVGVATSGWVSLSGAGDITYTGATTTPQRKSQRYDVTAGRYEVRVRRYDVENKESRAGHSIVWAGMRSYMKESRTYGDVTLLSVRMRATNNLSQASGRKLNVIATRKLPIWNGTTWNALTATRSPSWAIAYACKQVGLTDSSIDLSGLLTLHTTCAARGDNFDGRFDNFLSFWESVSKIAGAVRAKPYMQGGVLRIVRDQPASVPVAMFNMRNIVKGSFSVNYLMPTNDTADAVDVAYFDATTWASANVRAKLPASSALVPAKVDLFGVTSRDHAYREGMYQAASNRYRRKIITFKTEMEGFILSFGDLIAIQHDMPAWGQGGELTAWNLGTLTATLSEPPVFSTGPHYIGLRKRDGSVDGPHLVTAGAGANDVVLASAPAFALYVGATEERTHYAFGAAETWRQPARLLSAKPQSGTIVEIVAVGEDSNVHTAETGQITPAMVTSQLAGYTNAPVVTGVIAYPSRDNLAVMVLSWPAAPWADHYVIEQSLGGADWGACGDTYATTFLTPMLYGKGSRFRVAAVGLNRGAWFEVLPDVTPPPAFDIFNVMVQPDGTRQYNFGYSSQANQPSDWLGAEIRYMPGTVASPDWATMSLLQDATTYYTNSPVELNAPLSGTWTFACKSLDTTGNESAYLVRTLLLPDRRLGNVFDEFFEHSDGWPGTKTGCHIQAGVLEANDATTWATLPATWATWTRWNFSPSSPITYETPARDFGTVVAGQINSSVDADGTALVELATSTNGSTWSAWGSAAVAFSVRYIKLRLTVTATGPAPVPLVRAWGYQVNAPVKAEYINDVVISGLTGSYRIGVGDIRIPLAGSYTVLKRVNVTVQDSRPGAWTDNRVDNVLTFGPRWNFKLNGVLTDPDFVDFFIEGF